MSPLNIVSLRTFFGRSDQKSFDFTAKEIIHLVLHIFLGDNRDFIYSILVDKSMSYPNFFHRATDYFLRKSRENTISPPKKPPICAKLSTPSSRKPNAIAVAAKSSIVE